MSLLRPAAANAGALLLLAAMSLDLHAQTAERRQSPDGERTLRGVTLAGEDSVLLRLVDVELKIAVQAIGRFLDRPVLMDPLPPGVAAGARITFETPRPILRVALPGVLRSLIHGYGLEMVADSVGGLYRVRGREALTGATGAAAAGAAAGGIASSGAGVAPNQGPELFVIRLRHARAADVAATVNALFGRAGALGELGAPAAPPPTLRQQLDASALPRQIPAAISGQPPRAPGAAGESARGARLAGEVTIVPDANGNALLVRAARSDYELIQAAVRELDIRPLQVLIEVVIAEVRKDRSFNFGVSAKTAQQSVPGFPGATAKASQEGIGLGDFALEVMRQGAGIDFEATLRASASRGDARILSRPIVLASNGETAEILVGSQQPFVQVQRSLPTDAPTRDQVVQYKDVGTRLSVRPTISGDGYVSLAITQEVNNATGETQFDAPVIATRSVQTVLLARDSQTVVLGGLSDRLRESNQSGVPLLSSIPLLGGIFGRAGRRSTETEFFLFLTAKIIRTDQEASAVSEPYQRSAEGMNP